MARRRREKQLVPAAAPRRLRRARALALAGALVAAAGLGVAAWRASRPSSPNLLLVTLDTLRADRVGAYGHAEADTPVLDSLARRGARFANVLSPVPITGPAHASLFTGHYPPVHGVRDNLAFALDARHPTLATILKARGYRTAAFVGAFPVAAAYGFGRGFDHFNEDFHTTPLGSQGAERPGNEVADRAIEWLASTGEAPLFAWLHLYDPHEPYTPPPPFDARFEGRPYDGEVAFADAQVGRVLEALRPAGHARDTLVAVVADHGESLGEHGEATHAMLVYQATLHVPFVLAGPGVPSGVVVTPRASLVDVLPTLLGLLGVEPPPGLPGRDLRPALAGRRLAAEPLYSESLFGRLTCRWSSLRAWVSEDWKLVQGSEIELFDLEKDPGELRNLAKQEPQRLERMQGALHAALRKMAPSGDTAKGATLSPEQEERLRSLGYAGGRGGGGAVDEPGLPDPRARVQTYERIRHAMAAFGPAVPAALAEVERIVAEDPGNPFAHFAVGHLAYREGRFGTAARAFDQGLELDPERPNTRLPFGRLLREMGRLEDSERQLRIAIEQTGPGDDRTRIGLAETLVARGKMYLRLGQPARALQIAGGALARAVHPWAMAVTGHALILSGQREQGTELLRRALALRPRRPEAWQSLARAFDDAALPREAELSRRGAHAMVTK